MSSWKKVTLEEISESINTGLDAIRRAPIVDFETDIKCLRIQDISQNKPIESWGFTEVKNTDYSKFRLMKDDIIMARTCSTGICFLAKQDLPAVFNNGLARIRLKKDIAYPTYVYYVFKSKSFISYIDGISGGTSVQLNMKIGDLSKYSFDLPPLNIQKEIANKLSDLDKKIQLNTQINQTLEQIAQTIFKSWFIDFDPVHAKANALASGQTLEQATQAAMAVISGKNTQELHRLQTANPEQYQQLWEIAEAFPRGVDEEGVPRGWEMTVVKSVCEKIQNGGTPKRSNKEYWNNGNIPWLSSGEVCNNNILISSKEFITQFGLENSSTKLIEANSTLVALYASPTAGKCSFCAFKATTNQAVCALVPKEIYKYFNFYYLQTKEEYYSNQAVGSAQQNISKGIVEDTPILKPDSTILGYFNLIVVELMNKQISNLKESDYLKNIRDVLLPKLLSGEV
ncbi:restriction endonuclease subunit S [Glaesserella parasuis]|uniref:restriction endonuclease subunit S n=1 Tax=Glaesserella parasuis TaxID=738 RepID=UPI003851B4DE